MELKQAIDRLRIVGIDTRVRGRGMLIDDPPPWLEAKTKGGNWSYIDEIVENEIDNHVLLTWIFLHNRLQNYKSEQGHMTICQDCLMSAPIQVDTNKVVKGLPLVKCEMCGVKNIE